jgi:D-sedoheptulose 7-phosphate isomerase
MSIETVDFTGRYLERSLRALTELSRSEAEQRTLAAMAEAIAGSLRAGGKLMIAGNGGSAGDSQHIAGEFVARLMFDRAPLAAIALTVDGSVLTATGNDYGYEHVFDRQVRALARRGDVFLGISTSGRSPNVVRALDSARGIGALCLGFTGRGGGPMAELCDLIFRAPADETAIIQQLHITAAHIVCALVERAMFPDRVPA